MTTAPLTLAITTYNRLEYTLESFSQVVNHPRITEILIVDDHSKEEIYYKLMDAVIGVPKIKLLYQPHNRGMQQNKADAVYCSKEDWVILFDSDNVLSEQYMNSIPLVLDPSIIYVPSFAAPNFDMSPMAGKLVDKYNVNQYTNLECFNWFLNGCNYVVHRDEYEKVYKPSKEIKGTDTAAFAINWLKAGNRFYVMPGAKYFHRVHDGSEFLKDVDYNMHMAKQHLEEIKSNRW